MVGDDMGRNTFLQNWQNYHLIRNIDLLSLRDHRTTPSGVGTSVVRVLASVRRSYKHQKDPYNLINHHGMLTITVGT